MAEETLAIFKRSIPLLTILQDENRQQILMMLCKVDQMSVNQITEKLNLSRPAVSHHLKLLRDVGLVTVKQQGTERYYATHLDAAIKLLKELTRSLERESQSR